MNYLMKILLMTSCHVQLATTVIKCISMKKNMQLNNYKEHKQIHYISNHFDNGYNKLSDLTICYDD